MRVIREVSLCLLSLAAASRSFEPSSGGELANAYKEVKQQIVVSFPPQGFHSVERSAQASNELGDFFYKADVERVLVKPFTAVVKVALIGQHCPFDHPETVYSQQGSQVSCPSIANVTQSSPTSVMTRLAVANISASDSGDSRTHMFPLSNAALKSVVWRSEAELTYRFWDNRAINVTIDIVTLQPTGFQKQWQSAKPLSYLQDKNPEGAPQRDVKFAFQGNWNKLTQKVFRKSELVAHKSVLSRESKYFNALFERFQHNTRGAAIYNHSVPKEFSYDTINNMLSFMYFGHITSPVQSSISSVMKLYEAAVYYGVEWLELLCILDYIKIHIRQQGQKKMELRFEANTALEKFAYVLKAEMKMAKQEQRQQTQFLHSTVALPGL
jgi:hypothetical protein